MPHSPAALRPSAVPAAQGNVRVPQMFLLLLAAWLFDFQSGGEGAGVDIQAYFAVTYLFALVMLVIGDRSAGQRVQGLLAMMGCGALYLLVGIGVGLLGGQEAYPILRNAMSVAIYLSAAYATARVVLIAAPSRLRLVLAIACLGYAGSSYVIFNLTGGGIDFDKVRFQIVGASAIAALGYGVLIVLFRLTRIEQAALALNGLIVLISVTRTFMLVFAAQAAVFAGMVRRVFSPRAIVAGLAGIAALLAVLTYGQSQLVRWEERISGTGSDYAEYQTLYTRLSEWDFMYREWTASPGRLLFGAGVAARTTYYLPREMGGGTEFMIGFGHNQYLSLLFTAGLIGGLPLLLLQIWQTLLGWRFIRNAIRLPRSRSDVVFLGAWGATILLGYFVSNIFASTFTTRGSSLWFGIGTGLLLGARARFDPANAPRQAGPAPLRASRYQPA